MHRLRSGGMRLLLLFAVIFVCSTPELHAEVFHTGRTLKPRAFSLGIEPQLVLKNPVGAEFNFHAGMGLVHGLDLGFLYTLPLPNSNLPQRLGLNFEVQLLPDSRQSPAISLALGGHVEDWHHYLLDGTLMLSKVLGRIEPYFAVDGDLSLPPYPVYGSVRLVGGLNIHVSRLVELMIEGDWGVRNSYSMVSLGLNFYI